MELLYLTWDTTLKLQTIFLHSLHDTYHYMSGMGYIRNLFLNLFFFKVKL